MSRSCTSILGFVPIFLSTTSYANVLYDIVLCGLGFYTVPVYTMYTDVYTILYRNFGTAKYTHFGMYTRVYFIAFAYKRSRIK